MDRGAILLVEGSIGSGKSTLTTKLAGLLQFRAFHEPVESDYLDKFYKNPKEMAFEFQLRQLARREVIHHAAQSEALLHSDYLGSVLDRSLLGDRVFAALHREAGNISQEQWITYEILFHSAWGRLLPPALLLFLDVEPEVAMERVKNRNRGAESGLTVEYLRSLRKGYLDLLCEIESREQRWTDGVSVLRVPWNFDNQSASALVERIKDKLRMK
jgi:deoxyadenosine/deoxycytidine kinase